MSVSAKLNVCQSVFPPKPPNLISAKCTTHTVCMYICIYVYMYICIYVTMCLGVDVI